MSHVKGIRIPESVKFLLMKSGILGFGIQGTAQKNWNWESSVTDKQLGIHSWNLESMAWNPECKTLLDFLTWGE